MSDKPVQNVKAASAIVAEIDSIQRRLQMIKQYVDVESGTVKDTAVVAGLFNGTELCMDTVRNNLVKFL